MLSPRWLSRALAKVSLSQMKTGISQKRRWSFVSARWLFALSNKKERKHRYHLTVSSPTWWLIWITYNINKKSICRYIWCRWNLTSNTIVWTSWFQWFLRLRKLNVCVATFRISAWVDGQRDINIKQLELNNFSCNSRVYQVHKPHGDNSQGYTLQFQFASYTCDEISTDIWF